MREEAHLSPKKKSAAWPSAVRFGGAVEAVEAYFAARAGKILLICDGAEAALLAPAACSPRALCIVLDDGDALPLFTMSEGVGGVIAAGGSDVMRSARLFSRVMKLEPLLLPSDAALIGAVEGRGEVLIGGERRMLPLAVGEIVCDTERMRETLARAFGRLSLVRLSAFEEGVLARFGLAQASPLTQRALEAIADMGGGESVILASEKVRILEGEGLFCGEGYALLKEENVGELSVFRALLALYTAFFKYGRPRKDFVPDYRARADAAGAAYAVQCVPTAEEYAARALLLEKMRPVCCHELLALARETPRIMRTYRALGGTTPPPISGRMLAALPERAPHGLSALIRDFGLMEF